MPAGKRAEGFLLQDPKKQDLVLAEMRKREIPYEINDRGFVDYLLEDQAEVHGIKREVQYGEFLDPDVRESAVLIDQMVKNKYTSAFETADIPYDLSEYDGIMQISWSQKYGPQADLIRQRLDTEIMDIYINKATNKALKNDADKLGAF